MKRQTRLSKVTSERDAYHSQVAALLRAVEKADELLAQRDAELALADKHIADLYAAIERRDAIVDAAIADMGLAPCSEA